MRPGLRTDDAALGRQVIRILAVVAIVAGGYYAYRELSVKPAPPPEVVQEPVVTAPVAVIDNPVPPAADAPALPALGESDGTIAEQLAALLGGERFESLFFTDDLVRRITVTIDNLPRDKVAMRLRPLKPLGSSFVAGGEEGAHTLGPDNYARYAPFVALAEELDVADVAALYLRLYPLFQEAYVELGNLDGYFNDRVVEVIDHLLETPEIREPVPLVRPAVMFQFEDPALEARSAGQKFLLRMGPDNALRIKQQLRALRGRIASQAPPPA